MENLLAVSIRGMTVCVVQMLLFKTGKKAESKTKNTEKTLYIYLQTSGAHLRHIHKEYREILEGKVTCRLHKKYDEYKNLACLDGRGILWPLAIGSTLTRPIFRVSTLIFYAF